MGLGFRLYLLGSIALVALAGCGRGIQFGGERETWRHEAEVSCLKSGAVKESAVVVRIEPIEGPGMCGADFPLKVVALGDGPVLGYGDEIRPPASIPGGPERWPVAPQPQYSPAAQGRYMPPEPAPRVVAPQPQYAPPQSGPMSITPPDVSSRADAPGYEPIETRPVYDPRDATVQPLRPPQQQYRPQYSSQPPYDAPTRTPQYAPPDDYDDIPDDAVLPDRSKNPPRQSYQQPYQPSRPTPQLGRPMGNLNMTAGKATVTPAATLACPMVSALDQWVSEAVQPAAMKWFRQPVVEIKQISAYSCRGMVGAGTSHISEHAFGNALDVAGFVLSDGRKILVKNGWNGTPEETGFLHDVQMAACERFTTVLAPGYNIYHYDHMHLDLMRRASGRSACRPNAMTGEEAAARLSRSKYAAKNGGVTGAVGDKPMMKPRATAGEDGAFDDDLPTGSIKKKYKPIPAIAGEDGEFDD
ncbi:MAG: extensin family protein [Pseudolabrys sp.]|nr:extensin family protein [Pseudolabrys sp.]